ncbi:HD domain-containing protein [Periweissella ghanensis]|uniref:Uncharacterized protein n=1 Tax=Periweissella ghanensis TaxID=467997 RepID=A0ABN8BSG4_9LACO|nr:HD domain-containing protein [Periweissella ghanensis]MCM0600292.1 bifunctional (p)ppGpp synthetase/guanosine-3',5'-bis(diphosphate) 3'-pyrophosphohydrolase [Periweissella ghanensis]CAH0419177.1 hypothetical protein WGH24286_01624 [Periweissella ghanensis]
MTTPLIDAAQAYALRVHAKQTRKGKATPFTEHLKAVATIVSSLTDDEVLIATAWLHDTVEDTPTTIVDIEREFGTEVAKYVAMETENKRSETAENLTWRLRKEEQINHLAALTGIEQKIYTVAFADKLANLREIKTDLDQEGPLVWQRFNNQDMVAQRWYYQSFADIVGNWPVVGENPQYVELQELITQIWPQ